MQKAINIAKKERIIISTEMIPPCIAEDNSVIEELKSKDLMINAVEYHDQDFQTTQKEGRVKIGACKDCSMNQTCIGITKS